MASNRRIAVALAYCLAVLLAGTLGYMLLEGHSMLEALYMTIITVSTVGYGEVKALSETGRVFTILLIILSLGTLAFAGHTMVESLLEKTWSGESRIRKVKKLISQLKSHFIICGFGRVGLAAQEHFEKMGSPFVIIESDPVRYENMRENGYLCIEGDATREATLLEAGIKSAAGLVALLDSDPENLFIVLTARELNPTLHIIARSEDISSEKKILRAGADSVISPFATAGRQVAKNILITTGKVARSTEDCVISDQAPEWITVEEGSMATGETVGLFSQRMGREVIGLRRRDLDFILPDPDMEIESTDALLTVQMKGDLKGPSAQQRPSPRKLIIIDDNPVILRLYTRLFQRAGFYPMTASDGREGLDLVIKEKPVAAVIDFMLPVLSGIEVCKRVRSTEECKGTKLILFTADNQPETRRLALNAGADAVVVKSPEAAEVIDTVIEILNA